MQDSSGLQFHKSSTLGCTSCPRATRGPQMPCGLASGDGFPNLRVNALRSAYPIRRVLKDLGNLSMRLLKGVRRGSNPRPKLAKLLLPAVERAESKMVRKRPNPSALPFFRWSSSTTLTFCCNSARPFPKIKQRVRVLRRSASSRESHSTLIRSRRK